MKKRKGIVAIVALVVVFCFAMMVPASVYADWTGSILSERPEGQAEAAGWANEDGEISLLIWNSDAISFFGNGVIGLEVSDGPEIIGNYTASGTSKITVFTNPALGIGNAVILSHCEYVQQGDLFCSPVIQIYNAQIGTVINVELMGGFQQTEAQWPGGSQRGTLAFKLTAD